MTTQQERMLSKARARDGQIGFCGAKETWEDCFTAQAGSLMLWYNAGNDTHAIVEPIKPGGKEGLGLGAAGPQK